MLMLPVIPVTESTKHLINRATFGATPELIDTARALGNVGFIEQQLNPASIDNTEFEALLTDLGTPDTYSDLQDYQLLHAIFSKKQLKEVMSITQITSWFTIRTPVME